MRRNSSSRNARSESGIGAFDIVTDYTRWSSKLDNVKIRLP